MPDRRSAGACVARVAGVFGAAGATALLAGTLLAQTEGPSLEKLEKYRRDALVAGGFSPHGLAFSMYGEAGPACSAQA